MQFHPYCTVELLCVSVFVFGFLVNSSRASQIVDMEFPFSNPNHWSYCLRLGSYKTQFPMEEGLVAVVVGAF